MDKISVIIPVYNVEKYLSRCLESVINQTYENLEIILINDGSKDRSGLICDYYVKKDNRIKVFHQENQGLSAARNKGIEVASGEYIGFLDSDDYIEKDMYQILFSNAIKYDADITACSSKIMLLNGKVKLGESDGNILVLNKFEAVAEIINKIDGAVWNKLYKSNLIKSLKFERGKVHGEDLYFQFQCLTRCNKVVYVNSCKHNYIKRCNSITTSTFSERIFDQVYFKDLIYDLIDKEFKEYRITAKKWCFNARMNVCRKFILANKSKIYKKIIEEYKEFCVINYKEIKSNLSIKEKVDYLCFRYINLFYPWVIRFYSKK